MKRTTLVLAVAAVAIVAGACSSSPGDEQGGPVVAAACTQEDPDCEDTLTVDDLPPGDESPPISTDVGSVGGLVVGGGLTVSEALATEATGVLAVQGFVVIDTNGAFLCEVLAESFPPQCGGARLPIADATSIPDLVDIRTDQGVTWSEDSVTLLGEIVGGELVLDPLSA